MLLGAALVGCSGGSGGGAEDFNPVPSVPEMQAISGQVQGLNGTVVLNWADRSERLTAGAFSIARAFDTNDTITLSLSASPLGQACTIDGQTTFTSQANDIAGVSITCIDRNVVRVQVENFFTGAPVAGTEVTAAWVDQGTPGTLSGTVDAQGQLTLELPTFDGRVAFNADITGFGEQSAVVLNTDTPAGRTARLLMQPVNANTSFSAVDGADLTVSGNALARIPANGLVVQATGAPYSGSVTAELTIVDPGVAPDLMPGDYTALDTLGNQALFRTYGGLSITLTGAGGEVLDLAPGQTADLLIPVADQELSRPLPATLAMYYYDGATGFWNEEGQASLQTLGTGLRVYSGSVSHFTGWSVNTTYPPVFVNGCVVNAQGNALDNVRIDATGQSYIGTSAAISGTDGMFAVPVRQSSTVLITAGDGLQSRTEQLSTTTTNSTIADCFVATAGSSTINLSWGQNPSDLDTHLFGRSATNSEESFHIDYTQRTVTRNSITIELDVDDVTSFGPEVTTIPDFPFAGTYRYGVHLFSGTGTIASSPARVELNLAGDVTVFVPPGGTPTRCWMVFDIVVDAGGFPTLNVIDDWVSESDCTSDGFIGSSATGGQGSAPLAQPGNPLIKEIEQKYYQ